MRDSFKYLTGAAITYLLVAACSGVEASDSSLQASGDASPGSGGSQAGQQGTAGSGQLDDDAGLLDRFVAAVDSAIDLFDSAISSAADSATDPVPAVSANESGSRIKAKWLVGDDGSRQHQGWYDSQREEDCSWSAGTDGSRRCLPGGAGVSGHFTDSACTARIFAVTTANCTNLGLNYIAQSDCSAVFPYSYEIHTLSSVPLTPGTAVYSMSGENCVGAVIPDNVYAYHSSTGVIPPSSFARGTVQTDQ